VEGDAREEVRDLPVGVDRKHNRKGVAQVRRDVEERLPLVQSFLDEFVLLVVEFEDGFLEVTDTAVDELSRLG
jgi:hypothetical protein